MWWPAPHRLTPWGCPQTLGSQPLGSARTFLKVLPRGNKSRGKQEAVAEGHTLHKPSHSFLGEGCGYPHPTAPARQGTWGRPQRRVGETEAKVSPLGLSPKHLLNNALV